MDGARRLESTTPKAGAGQVAVTMLGAAVTKADVYGVSTSDAPRC
jgi:hypothetical protein